MLLARQVSVLFNEPKLLKPGAWGTSRASGLSFSALQRAEIAEIVLLVNRDTGEMGFSALQRAEIAEIRAAWRRSGLLRSFQCSSTSRNC